MENKSPPQKTKKDYSRPLSQFWPVVLTDQQLPMKQLTYNITKKHRKYCKKCSCSSHSFIGFNNYFTEPKQLIGSKLRIPMKTSLQKVDAFNLLLSEAISLVYLLLSSSLILIAMFIPKIGNIDVWEKAFDAYCHAKFISEFNKLPITIDGVRASMLQLPKWIQPILTYVTGKPYEGEKPWSRSNLSYLFTTISALITGMYLSFLGYKTENVLFVLISWLLTVYSVRKVGPVVNHYIVHKDFFDKKLRDYIGQLRSEKYQKMLGEFLASMFSLQNLKDYANEHAGTKGHHKDDITATSKDPDNYFLSLLGLKAGMTKNELYKRFFQLILNPFSKLQRLFFMSRIKSQISAETPLLKKVISALFMIIPMVFAFYFGPTLVMITWWIPVFVLTPVAAIFQFGSEHFWSKGTDVHGTVEELTRREKNVRSKKLTVGRFCGEALPVLDGNCLFNYSVILIWSVRMIKHVVIRIAVLQGDLVAHDLHHRVKFGFDWANWIFTREQFTKELKADDVPLVDIWGYGSVLETIFDSMAAMDSKIEYDNKIVESFSAENAVLGM